jgi:hypothetical protein
MNQKNNIPSSLPISILFRDVLVTKNRMVRDSISLLITSCDNVKTNKIPNKKIDSIKPVVYESCFVIPSISIGNVFTNLAEIKETLIKIPMIIIGRTPLNSSLHSLKQIAHISFAPLMEESHQYLRDC